MEGPYAHFLQLVKAGSSIFAPDLIYLLELVGRPVAEFKGITMPVEGPNEIHMVVECTLRGSVVPPVTDTIDFVVHARSWPEGVCRATQEAIARLVRYH